SVDDQVREIAGMGAGWVQEPVLPRQRVVVTAGRGERRSARRNGMDVDPVKAGGQARDVDIDVNQARAVLDELRPADDGTAGVDEARARLSSAVARCRRSD